MATFDLSNVAPRLAAAHKGRQLEIIAARVARHVARERLQHCEWLVDHRDLQLQRAFAKGNRRYIEIRTRKLEQARAELARAQQRADELGACA